MDGVVDPALSANVLEEELLPIAARRAKIRAYFTPARAVLDSGGRRLSPATPVDEAWDGRAGR